MKLNLIVFFLTITTTFCNAQDLEKIYQFMNNELPEHEMGKSSWGIFLLQKPVQLGESSFKRIKEAKLKNVPVNIQSELYKKCSSTNISWPKQFVWDQSKMKHVLVVKTTESKISLSILPKLKWSPSQIKIAKDWITEWNKSKLNDRLVNYSSIPVFSTNADYVLMLRGQDVRSEGGWDTIYIYKKEKNIWKIAEKIVVSQI